MTKVNNVHSLPLLTSEQEDVYDSFCSMINAIQW